MRKKMNVLNVLKSNSGSSLIEVMVAVYVLVVALLGTLLAFINGSIYMAEVKQRSIAAQALTEEIEEIRGMSYSTITSLSSSFSTAGFSYLKDPTGTLTIDNPFSDSDIRRVTASVAWTTPQGRSLSMELSTYVTNTGINKQ